MELVRELERTRELMRDVTGYRPQLMRPSYGDMNERAVQVIRNIGYRVVLWDIDSLDWSSIPSPGINIILYLQSGSIVLHHNVAGTVQTLPYIIEVVTKIGYHFVSIADLINACLLQNMIGRNSVLCLAVIK